MCEPKNIPYQAHFPAMEPTPGEKVPVAPCPNCQAVMAAQDKFCSQCGYSVQSCPQKCQPAEKAGMPKGADDLPAKHWEPDILPVIEEVRRQAIALAPCPTEINPQTIPCPCGQTLPPEARFCLSCGTPVRPSPAPSYQLCRVLPGQNPVATGFNNVQLTIGKAADNDLMIADDDYISRRHARIYHQGGKFFVEDTGSSNGTYWKIRRPFELQDGDEILIGRNLLVWRKSTP